ncbi:MAG: hypothetical protein E6Y16_02230 [Veillonella sp.]|uniref:hypothetical protein n=1 Tax=Veillonella sp. TaxID=1926307 RepID=UPI0029097B80|nr:hypothetical protein [Veillonella sp.]MDU4711924.1 hypothetical protein [Veillonella sp.]
MDKWERAMDELEFGGSSKQSIIEALGILSFKQSGACYWSIAIVLAGVIISFINIRYTTIFNSLIDTIIIVQLAIFGAIFTLYSIILVFFSDSLTNFLIDFDSKRNLSKFREFTSYYGDLLYVIFTSILVSILYKILLLRGDEYFIEDCFVYVEKGLGIIYLVFVLRCILEIYSAIFNTISLFKISMHIKIKNLQNKDE